MRPEGAIELMGLRDLFVTTTAAFLLWGCDGASGGAAIEIAGASRAQHDGIARIYVTLDRLEAYVVDPIARVAQKDGSLARPVAVESGWRSIRLPADRTIDLLQLGGDHTKTLGELDLVSGTITELRLTLDEQGDNRIVLTGGESCVLDLSRFPSTGVPINDPTLPIDFDERHRVRLVVDFDLGGTLTQGDHCRFALLPQIALKTVGSGDEVDTASETAAADALRVK